MTVYLDTPLPKLAGDFMDVIRVFFGPGSFELAKHHPDGLTHTLTEEDGLWRCAFWWKGHMAEGSAPVPTDADPWRQELLRKRWLKRLCKQTLYDLCREITGIHPPWGSLTGIRPTRLLYEAHNKGMTLEEGAAHLVRTYDLHADKAELLKDIVKVQMGLLPPNDGETDVYIGIPFCVSRCAYCSFLSGEIGKGKQVPPFLEALEKEMAFTGQLIREKGLKLRAVYMGGGTPTSLTAPQLEKVLHWMRRDFDGAMEYTVEAGRPDTITREKLLAIQNAGVTRISLNPQTMSDETLRRIGRNHTVHQTYESYALARSMGFNHINMDVIAGLPGETLGDFEHTMAGALELKPESLTVHTLAIKRSSRLHLEEAPLPDGDMVAQMVRLGQHTAYQLGMAPYYLYRQKYMAGNQENVGYALPGHACQYNVDIMEETTHILAVGAGGISKRIIGNEGRIERAPNVSDITQYIDRVDEMLERKAQLWAE